MLPSYLYMDKIMDHLYIAGREQASNKSLLEAYKITHVLIVARYVYPEFPDKLKYKAIPADDLPMFDLFKYFEDAIQFIRTGRAKGNVLVHCAAGISRSSTIVIAYVMKEIGMSSKAAIEYVTKRHSITSPNAGFITQLKMFEKAIVH